MSIQHLSFDDFRTLSTTLSQIKRTCWTPYPIFVTGLIIVTYCGYGTTLHGAHTASHADPVSPGFAIFFKF